MTESGSRGARSFGPFRVRLVPAGDPSSDLEVFAAVGGAIVIAAALLLPLESIAGFLGGCRFKSAVGLPCMTCGATRAVVALSELDLFGALRYQPVVAFAALVVVLYTPVAWALWLLRLPRLRIGASSRRAFWILLALGGVTLLVNWAFLIADGR